MQFNEEEMISLFYLFIYLFLTVKYHFIFMWQVF